MLPANTKLKDFMNYISTNVFLIINKVENTISCERIFSNLNTNKVDLTCADLIKGLLLTKSAREHLINNKPLKYNEILEERISMGRQWDEIDNWVNQDEIKSFYFNESVEPISNLLLLIAIRGGYKDINSIDKYNLFNYYQSQIKKGKHSAKEYFDELKMIKSVLCDWFINPETYNLYGYLFNIKGSKNIIIDFIDKIENNKTLLVDELRKIVQIYISTDINNLNYNDNYNDIYNLLLALSVFGNDGYFDFHSFKENDWSLEHIFPQTPEKFSKELQETDIKIINDIIGTKLLESIKNEPLEKDSKEYHCRIQLSEKLKQKTCVLEDSELDILCKLLDSKLINSIGNMALLTKQDNSSNSNGMYNIKRLNISHRISSGSFVPKHTYDVFSKLLSNKMDPNLSVWTEQDIKAHEEWIHDTIKKII